MQVGGQRAGTATGKLSRVRRKVRDVDTLADYDRAKEMRDALTVLGLASPIIKQLRELPPSVAMPLMQQLLDAEPTAIPRVNAASTLV